MAGTLRINDTAVWMPAGWIYDGVLEAIATELASDDRSLSAELRKALTGARGYYDLRTLDRTRFLMLVNAAERVFARTVLQGPQSFADPAFYPGFVRHFENLRGFLKADVRAAPAG
jgi:hypothetical protein